MSPGLKVGTVHARNGTGAEGGGLGRRLALGGSEGLEEVERG